MRFFIDMDGVLVDFEKGFESIYGEDSFEFKKRVFNLYRYIDPESTEFICKDVIEHRFDELFWHMIDAVPRFWEKLPPFKSEVNDINLFLQDYPDIEVRILSSVPIRWDSYQKAINGKLIWLNKYITSRVLECYFPVARYYGDDNKSKFCENENDVLIDDSKFHIDAWQLMGGKSIQYDSSRSNNNSLYSQLRLFVEEKC